LGKKKDQIGCPRTLKAESSFLGNFLAPGVTCTKSQLSKKGEENGLLRDRRGKSIVKKKRNPLFAPQTSLLPAPNWGGGGCSMREPTCGPGTTPQGWTGKRKGGEGY